MSPRRTAPATPTLLVIAKEPLPGRVKTRLTPPYTPQEAAALAEAALTDTLHALLRTPARRRVLVLDGSPGAWLPSGYEVAPQAAGGLDERIAAAFGLCDDGPALLVGMDTPQLTPACWPGSAATGTTPGSDPPPTAASGPWASPNPPAPGPSSPAWRCPPTAPEPSSADGSPTRA